MAEYNYKARFSSSSLDIYIDDCSGICSALIQFKLTFLRWLHFAVDQ
jgi:hypothetical protein